MATAKPSRSGRPSRRAAAAKPAPKAKPAARAGKPAAKPAAKARRSTAEPKKPKIDPKLPAKVQAEARRRHAIAQRQITELEIKATNRVIAKEADRLVKAAQQKSIKEAAQMLAEQRIQDLIASGNHDHLVGDDKFWQQVTPEAEKAVRQKQAAKERALAERKRAEQQMAAAQAQGLQKMNPKAASKAQAKGKRG